MNFHVPVTQFEQLLIHNSRPVLFHLHPIRLYLGYFETKPSHTISLYIVYYVSLKNRKLVNISTILKNVTIIFNSIK